MQEINFTVHGTPVAQPRAKKFFNPKKKKMHGYVKKDHLVHNWRQLIRMTVISLIEEDKWRFIQKPAGIELLIEFYFLKPKSRPKKLGEAHTVRPDLDNLVKAVKDALNSVAYEDDSQIYLCAAAKYYYEKRPTTRIRMRSFKNINDKGRA